MSDSKSTYGEPVDEPKPVDDVVGSVNESLADAEAAGRDAVSDSETSTGDEPAAAPSEASAEPYAAPSAEPYAPYAAPAEPAAEPYAAPAESYTPPAASEAAASEPTDDEITDAAAYAAAYSAASADEPAPYEQSTVAAQAYDPAAETVVVAPLVAPSEPVGAEYAAAPVGPQPIFVQAPEAPRPRGNRAAAGAIGLLAALSFAVLYLGAWLGIGLLDGDVRTDRLVDAITIALSSWIFWTPVVFFFVGFWLLGAIINRGRWGHWVVFGLFVGLVAWFGYIAGEFFAAPFWMLTPTAGVELLQTHVFTPLAIVAFIIGRELTIWFGAWAAARGKRVTELNTEAMREYERTLEAGPQLYRQ
jgi:hypothetical protein